MNKYIVVVERAKLKWLLMMLLLLLLLTTTATEKPFFHLNVVIKPPKNISFYFHLYINTMLIECSCSCFFSHLSLFIFLIRSIEREKYACLFVLVGESFIMSVLFSVMSMPSISVVAYCNRVSLFFCFCFQYQKQ